MRDAGQQQAPTVVRFAELTTGCIGNGQAIIKMLKRKQHAPEFKALEALKGEETVSERARRFGVPPTMIHP